MPERVKLQHGFQLLGDYGDTRNREKFGDLKGGMFEFKAGQIRMPFAYCKKAGQTVVITHGFRKKSNKAPKAEIERAWRIFREDQDGGGRLTLVQGSKA